MAKRSAFYYYQHDGIRSRAYATKGQAHRWACNYSRKHGVFVTLHDASGERLAIIGRFYRSERLGAVTIPEE